MTAEGPRESHRCARNSRCADRERHVERPATCTECACHDHPGTPCDVPGGCGLEHHPETETWYGAYIPTEQGLCRLCCDRVEQAINSMVGNIRELSVLIAAGLGVSDTGGKVRGTPTPPVPIRLGVEAVRAAIDDELSTWAEVVAERLGMDWSTDLHRRRRIEHRVAGCAKLLAPNVDMLVTVPPIEVPVWVDGEPVRDEDGAREYELRDGLDGALGLLDLHYRVFRAAGRTRLVHRLSAPCPHCGQRTVTQENGSDVKRCESEVCRGREVPERSADWLAAVVEYERKRVNAA